MTDLRISVIIPVHDGAQFLAQTLRSVLDQTVAPDEVIVVDDGSSDESAAIAEGFGARVQVIRGKYGGAAAARVAGVTRATGEAIMFMDADDLLGRNVLQSLADTLSHNEGGIACCDWMRYERIGSTWQARPASCAPRRPGQSPLAAWLTGWYHPPCSVLWSRQAYERSGGWNPEILVNNDGDLMMRALSRGIELVHTPRGTSYYRRLPDGAVSLSGRRFSAEGLASRLTVLDGLASAGLAPGTRAALAEAYGNVAGDAEAAGQPELAGRARAEDLRHGGTPLWALRRRRADRERARARAARGKPDESTAPPHPSLSLKEHQTGAPAVSIVVPTFNRTALLTRALESVLDQDFRDFEVLVIDDASDEDIAAVVTGIGDPRLEYRRQPRNMGVAAARNRGMAEASGRYIAFLDSDDEWLPGKLSAQVTKMEACPPSVGLIYTGLIEKGSDGASTVFLPEDRGDVWREMMHRNVVHYGTSSTMIRREVVETIGGFDESLPAIEDYDFWTRIARFYTFECVPEPLMIYHDEAAEEGVPSDKRSRDFEANMAARRMFFDRYGEEAVRAGVLHLGHLDMARRHIEAEDGRQSRAILSLLKAIRRKPTSPRIYAWLAFASLPAPLRRSLFPKLVRLRTRLPAWIWMGPGRA